MKGQKRTIVSWFLAILLSAIAAAAGGAAVWHQLSGRPYCVYKDCRGLGLWVENMRQWEEQMEAKDLGVIRMAGWRIGTEQAITSISTKRKGTACVTWVYGSMELAGSAELLWGRFGLELDKGYCVISEELARDLFGSTDVAGESVKTEDGTMAVAGVIDKEGEILMAPAADGRIEYLAVEFDSRIGAEEKVKRLLEEY